MDFANNKIFLGEVNGPLVRQLIAAAEIDLKRYAERRRITADRRQAKKNGLPRHALGKAPTTFFALSVLNSADTPIDVLRNAAKKYPKCFSDPKVSDKIDWLHGLPNLVAVIEHALEDNK